MSEPIYLILGIHHHQPVGNFGSVFQMAFEKCYRPFLEILENNPKIKISLHHSGPLLDWASENEGNYLERVCTLAKRGQIEILGGGYYEPILPILKPKDALGQIEMMQDFWQKRIGSKPVGMWLAERVWEPSLAALLHDAGMLFTILDDEHFRHAGLADEFLFGNFQTERAGKSVSIFPSDKILRYMIPFREPKDVINHLLYLQSHFPGKAITYGDDGEKFGVWPGTYEWVIEKGWLTQFFKMLGENIDKIKTITFSEYLKMQPPSASIYLPTASYSEMLEWAMPAQSIIKYELAKKSVEKAGLWNSVEPFFRGGYWDNFLTKYPESNLIHKRVIYTSNKLDEAEKLGHDVKKARHALYRAQCNCAYWHGLFGGLYLNYLRHALYQNLIEADVAADNFLKKGKDHRHLELLDIDCDGSKEVILSNETLSCLIKPNVGASIASLDFRPKRFNLLNTLARRFEAYHELKNTSENGNAGTIHSIHDMGKDLGDLKTLLTYDPCPRYAFLDHLFFTEPDSNAILENKNNNSTFLGNSRYLTEISNSIVLSKNDKACIEKEFVLGENGNLKINYKLGASENQQLPLWFATEINFTLLAGHAPDRYYKWNGIFEGEFLMDTKRTIENISWIEAIDKAFGFKMRIEMNADRVILKPVETVSQSEKGFDKIYQGSTIWLLWKPKWTSNNESKFSVGILVEPV